MGLSEWLRKGIRKGGSVLGVAGSTLGLTADGLAKAAANSTIEEKKKDLKKDSGYVGMAAGGARAASGLIGVLKSSNIFGGNNKESNKTGPEQGYEALGTTLNQRGSKEKKVSIPGIISGGAGIVSGIASFFAEMAKKNGEENKTAGWFSSIAGLIGSGADLVSGLYDYKDANGDSKKKWMAINSMTGASANLLGGSLGIIGNLIGGDHGDNIALAGSVIGNGIGAITGLIGSIFGNTAEDE